MRVGGGVQGDDVAGTKEFAGGLYAVTETILRDVTDTWDKFHLGIPWMRGHRCEYDVERRWLEEHLTLASRLSETAPVDELDTPDSRLDISERPEDELTGRPMGERVKEQRSDRSCGDGSGEEGSTLPVVCALKSVGLV